jgi:hypothetical protein
MGRADDDWRIAAVEKFTRRYHGPVTPLAAVRGTMLLATVAWALGEALMRREPEFDRLARAIWTAGIALALIHVFLAFQFVYGWDHDAAIEATTRQTAEVVDSSFRGGIFVNYVFLLIWLADVCWWWLSPESHASRSRRLELGRLALFAFMFFNGAIVFASGPGRWIGIASLALVLVTSVAHRLPAVPAVRSRVGNR